MVYRALITVVAWLAGILFLVTNGQVFTQDLIILGSCIVGSVPWVPLMQRQPDPRRRAVAVSVVGVSVIAIVGIAFNLPTSYEAQRHFNDRSATPNSAFQSDDQPPRDAWSAARR